MFQFSALANVHLWIQCTTVRESRDQRSLDSYPRLIAACHALLRLLTPRHPPCALNSLTTWTQDSHPRRAAFLRRPPGHGNTGPYGPLPGPSRGQKSRFSAQVTIMLFLRSSSIACAIEPTTFGIAKAHSTSRRAALAERHRLGRRTRCHLSQQPNCQRSNGPGPKGPLHRPVKLTGVEFLSHSLRQTGFGTRPLSICSTRPLRVQGRTASIPVAPIPVKALPTGTEFFFSSIAPFGYPLRRRHVRRISPTKVS